VAHSSIPTPTQPEEQEPSPERQETAKGAKGSPRTRAQISETLLKVIAPDQNGEPLSAQTRAEPHISELSELDIRRQHAARNQSLFREVNERIESISSTASFVSFVCECADPRCDAHLPLTREEYEHVRSRPTHFVVLPGHNIVDVESIDEACDRYFIVGKFGAGAQLARELDPRSM
jgi:hypothetical protein